MRELRPARTPKLNHHGYQLVWCPGHPNAQSGGMILEHRLVAAQMLGRPLSREETVHHKNGDRTDNRPENLEVWPTKHPKGQRIPDIVADAHRKLALYGGLPAEDDAHYW